MNQGEEFGFYPPYNKVTKEGLRQQSDRFRYLGQWATLSLCKSNVLEHSHAHSFIYCLWVVLPPFHGSILHHQKWVVVAKTRWPANLKYFLSAPLRRSCPTSVKIPPAALWSMNSREGVEVQAGDDEAEVRANGGDEMWTDSGKSVIRPTEEEFQRKAEKAMFCCHWLVDTL